METPKRRKPVPRNRRPALKNKRDQYTAILREITGTLMAALIFAASMWSSVDGMIGGFDADANVMALLLTAGSKRRNPPYSKQLNRSKRTLWICCGSYAWERVTWPTWMPGAKVLLPLGEHPSSFRWNCAEGFEDCVIIAEGKQPYLDEITYLAGELLVYVDLVIFIDNKGNTHRFDAEREAA
jgi:hypothetical protein